MAEVIFSDCLGYCFGVKRAIDLVKGLKGNYYTLGPLIHNSYVVKDLEKRGIKRIDSLKNLKKGTVIIRTHGVPESVYNEAKKKGLKLIDATCPFVSKAQHIANDFFSDGCRVVVIGDRNHPEVIGIVNEKKDIIVVSMPEEIDNIGFYNKIGVVAQTTQDIENFNNIVIKLKGHCRDLKVINTICNATSQRQEAARELSKKVELMIVVGDRQSGNTKRLFEICKNNCESVLIESADEVKLEWKKYVQIGITAGASTPDFLIQEIFEKLEGNYNFEKKLDEFKLNINKELEIFFNHIIKDEKNFFMKSSYTELKRYVLAGGKRLRPIALIAAYKGCGGKGEVFFESMSVELLHCSTLIHDDIMDEDEFRRGKESIHRVMRNFFLSGRKEEFYNGSLFNKSSSRFAVSNAICDGNMLYSLGAGCLKSCFDVYHKAYCVVNEGQILDGLSEVNPAISENDYLDMVEKKTANLFAASVVIGAIYAGAKKKTVDCLKNYALCASTAFQIQDDVMDISSHMEKGRKIGSDIRQGKKNILFIKALEGCLPEEKKILKGIIGKDSSEKEINRAIDIIYTSGAVDYATNFAKKKIKEGKKYLKKARLNKEGYEFFLEFADMMLKRRK